MSQTETAILPENKGQQVAAPDAACTKKLETLFQNSHAANCKTFGEKFYSGVFDWGINFGVNLVVSAAFTQWVKHGSNPVWKNAPFGKTVFQQSPENAYHTVRKAIQNTTGFGPEPARIMADALTLTTAGSAVMVPSVWLGAKVKSAFVQTVDNWWYGKNSANDPWIEHRHDVVDDAPKASLFGAVVGRAGTMAAVQLSAATLGSNKNLLSWVGKTSNSSWLQKFEGLDHYSKTIGNAAGTAFSDAMPNVSKRLDIFTRGRNFVHSTEQIKINPALAKQPYTGALADYTRYTALDTMYTIVTMGTIHPIINAVKSYIPGITYKERTQRKPDTRVIQARSESRLEEHPAAARFAHE